MKILLNRKEINKSLLTDGISLPKEIYTDLFKLLGKRLNKGDKEGVTIVIDNIHFEASLNNSNAKDRKDELLQFRWSMDIGNKMRSLFTDSKPKLVTKDGGAVKGKTQPITEYVNIIATNPHTYMFDCHYKLTDVEYALCKENFNYIAAAKAKPFLILGGFSGTGKSQKVKELAYLTCPELDDLQKGQDPGNYCLISVKPNWHDSTELLGYYSNIGRKYVCTEFMKFIVKAMKYPLVPFFVCMDEMNLAPVEEYFAEYLSVLESRKSEGGRVVSSALVSSDIFTRTYEDYDIFKALGLTDKNAAIIDELKQSGLCLPQNLIVIGTVNMDDTTNSFSRKVIDRAMTFETKIEDIEAISYFNLNNDALSYKNIACPERFINDQVRVLEIMKEPTPDFKIEAGETDINKEFTQFINEINKAMGNGKGYDTKEGIGISPFQVSYRVLNEAVLYYRSLQVLYPEQALMEKVFNDILMMKVLPRIEGEQDRAKKPLEGLQQFISKRIGDDTDKRVLWEDSLQKIDYMLRPFGKGGDGFTTFWQ